MIKGLRFLRPLSAAEVQAHPEFPYTTWDLKPQSKGKLSVAKGRGGPLDIAWEVHGEGENKMVVSVFFIFAHAMYSGPIFQRRRIYGFVIMTGLLSTLHNIIFYSTCRGTQTQSSDIRCDVSGSWDLVDSRPHGKDRPRTSLTPKDQSISL